MKKINEYLTVKQAAEFLGVTPNTLRNWELSGKFKARRHPANNYRIYTQEELEEVLRRIGGGDHALFRKRG